MSVYYSYFYVGSFCHVGWHQVQHSHETAEHTVIAE